MAIVDCFRFVTSHWAILFIRTSDLDLDWFVASCGKLCTRWVFNPYRTNARLFWRLANSAVVFSRMRLPYYLSSLSVMRSVVRWRTWSARATTWRPRTIRSCNCTPRPVSTTSRSGCCTTSSCSPPRTTSVRAPTSNPNGESDTSDYVTAGVAHSNRGFALTVVLSLLWKGRTKSAPGLIRFFNMLLKMSNFFPRKNAHNLYSRTLEGGCKRASPP